MCRSTKAILVVGQSNANGYFKNAVIDAALERDEPAVVGHYYKGGHQLKHWIDESGVKGSLWSLMMNELYETIDGLLDGGGSLSGIQVVFWQGESDTANGDTQAALAAGTRSIYVDKLQHFINTFSAEMEARYGRTPDYSVALVDFNREHQTYIDTANLTEDSITSIHSDFRIVARANDNVRLFDTPYDKRDHVHTRYYPHESKAMLLAARDALSLFDC